jgi:hypothetical protein
MTLRFIGSKSGCNVGVLLRCGSSPAAMARCAVSRCLDIDRLPMLLAINKTLVATGQEPILQSKENIIGIADDLQVRWSADISSLGVYVLFRTTSGQPILATPSTHSMYSTRLPAIMATMSPFWTPVASSALAVASLRASKSRKLYLIFCHGTTTAVFSPKRRTCSCKSTPMVLCHNGRWVGPRIND